MGDVEILLKIITTGMRVLSTRLILILTLLLTFVLFVWVLYQPDYFRLAAATIFALLVFIPVRALDVGGSTNASENPK